jgi:uncharacterized membrane protein YgdD (TMEM256/DUF423 family)
MLADAVEPKEKLLDLWQIAVRFQTTYALLLALFGLLLAKDSKASLIAGTCLSVTGLLLFCGSFYARILLGQPQISLISPLGGLCFMGAWLCLFIYAWGLGASNRSGDRPSEG